jgi:hypothetical protein
MSKRTRKTLWILAVTLVLAGALSRVAPNRATVVITGADGEVRAESTGPGPRAVRVEMPDGAFAESVAW